ncbi:MAG: c-type cytochrome [Legionellales bacterium]|jgi:cytochrome c5
MRFSRLCLGLAVMLISALTVAIADPLTRAQIIENNTNPIGQVTVAGASAQAAAAAAAANAPMTGEQLYKKNCAFCHDNGTAGAPKYADKGSWAPHLAKGIEVLKEHSLKGFKAMPAKGLCPQCSDEETLSAFDYMLKSVQ